MNGARRTCWQISTAIVITIICATGAYAQSLDSLQRSADALFQAGEWKGAAGVYEEIVRDQPANGRAWYRLGVARHRSGAYNDAVAAYRHAVDIGANPIAMYNLACSFAKLGSRDSALVWLDHAATAGFSQPSQISGDSDLIALRSDHRFKEVIERVERNARPCAYAPEFRQFDFWVGEWDVRSAQGTLLGTSSVQMILGECVILENWRGAGGGEGKSFNSFNPATKQWQQFWVSDRGGILEFHGTFSDSAMRFTGETPDGNGGIVQQRLTFFNQSPDRVRQLWEQSSDGGTTWSVVFDGIYHRRK